MSTYYKPKSRRKYKYRQPQRWNWDAADGLRLNQINRNQLVGERCWEADQLSDPNVTYYDDDSPLGAKRGPIKKIFAVNRRKQSFINGYKGKINGDE